MYRGELVWVGLTRAGCRRSADVGGRSRAGIGRVLVVVGAVQTRSAVGDGAIQMVVLHRLMDRGVVWVELVVRRMRGRGRRGSRHRCGAREKGCYWLREGSEPRAEWEVVRRGLSLSRTKNVSLEQPQSVFCGGGTVEFLQVRSVVWVYRDCCRTTDGDGTAQHSQLSGGSRRVAGGHRGRRRAMTCVGASADRRGGRLGLCLSGSGVCEALV
jgi:hypothetical protein